MTDDDAIPDDIRAAAEEFSAMPSALRSCTAAVEKWVTKPGWTGALWADAKLAVEEIRAARAEMLHTRDAMWQAAADLRAERHRLEAEGRNAARLAIHLAETVSRLEVMLARVEDRPRVPDGCNDGDRV